jgi:hypothetical protein
MELLVRSDHPLGQPGVLRPAVALCATEKDARKVAITRDLEETATNGAAKST